MSMYILLFLVAWMAAITVALVRSFDAEDDQLDILGKISAEVRDLYDMLQKVLPTCDKRIDQIRDELIGVRDVTLKSQDERLVVLEQRLAALHEKIKEAVQKKIKETERIQKEKEQRSRSTKES